MRVAGSLAQIHDLADLPRHFGLVRQRVSRCQLFLNQVEGKEQLVFSKKGLVALHVTGLPNDLWLREQRAASCDDLSLRCLLILSLKGLTGRGQDILRLLQLSGSLRLAFFQQALLFVLPDGADNLIVEVLDNMEVVKYRLDMRATLLKGFLKV